jgi:hypothetical protein
VHPDEERERERCLAAVVILTTDEERDVWMTAP